MLILASNSASRRAMLDAAGISYTAIPSEIDERALEAGLAGASGEDVACALAKAKAVAVSLSNPSACVLGSDSLVTVEGKRFNKPADRDDAAAHLRCFSGRTLRLHSAAAIACAATVVWSHAETAQLRVRSLSESFISDYLAQEWPAVAGCVGVFRIEGPGVQLFEQIEGSHFTVLGMPLLPVISTLRTLGEVAS